MKKTIVTIAAAVAILSCMPVGAQNLKLKGIGHNNRYDDGEQMRSTYVAWNSEQGKAVFIVDNGIYAMTYDAQGLSMPTKEPAAGLSPEASAVGTGAPTKSCSKSASGMLRQASC